MIIKLISMLLGDFKENTDNRPSDKFCPEK